MKLRKANLNDSEILHNLLNSSDELQIGNVKETYSKNWVENVIKSETSIVLIAEENEEIIGFLIAHYLIDVGQSILNDLWVAPSHRNKGIATYLLKEYEKLSQKKAPYSTALVQTGNVKMDAFMKKQGYDKKYAFYIYDKNLN